MTLDHPRYSTSEDLLAHALATAQRDLQCETQLIRFRELKVRECEGFYSTPTRAAGAPKTWRKNQVAVRDSHALHDGAAALARRSVEMARMMIASVHGTDAFASRGRKAGSLESR